MSTEALGWAIKSSPCKGCTLLVHLMIADVANDMHSNKFWMSADELGKKARMSRRSVYRALDELTQRGLLELLERGRPGGKPSTYRFLMPVHSPAGGVPKRHKGMTKATRGYDKLATRTTKNSNELGASKTKDGEIFLPGTGRVKSR